MTAPFTQSHAVAATLDLWGDEIGGRIKTGSDEPLEHISPFIQFDPRVLAAVTDERAWAAAAAERCRALAAEVRRGIWPPDREGHFGDEVAFWAALSAAPDHLRDNPDPYVGIPPRKRDGNWTHVRETFDEHASHEKYFVPLFPDHPNLTAVLETYPMASWFDPP